MDNSIVEILLDFDVIGFHNYPNAPKEVAFLKYPHRHLFQIKVSMEVTDLDREKEIFIETERFKKILHKRFGTPCMFGAMSCEMIAEYIIEQDSRTTSVEVLEDGKGGARIRLI